MSAEKGEAMSKKIARIPITLDSAASCGETEEKIDEAIEQQRELYKQKGKPVFVWERNGEEVFLRYHQTYKKDMGDTAFKGKLKKGLTGCQLDGYICKPKAVWVIFWIIAAVFLILLVGLPVLLSQSPDIPLYYALPLLTFAAIGVYILVSLLMFDKKRLRTLNDYLRDFMKASNTDVLGEELEEELSRHG